VEARISSPFTVATAVFVVTGAVPSSPEVSMTRKPPTKATRMKIQMYFAEARIDDSKSSYSRQKKGRNQTAAEWSIAL
jgi:hypothetical protein